MDKHELLLAAIAVGSLVTAISTTIIALFIRSLFSKNGRAHIVEYTKDGNFSGSAYFSVGPVNPPPTGPPPKS